MHVYHIKELLMLNLFFNTLKQWKSVSLGNVQFNNHSQHNFVTVLAWS